VDDTFDDVDAQLRTHPCPTCGRHTLRLTLLLEALPLGGHSLSGDQLKVSAREWPYVICDTDDCDFRQRATLADDERGR
jgi:hypothetical protein